MNFNIYLLYMLKKIINVLIAQFMRHSESIPNVEIQCLQVSDMVDANILFLSMVF